MSILTLEEAMSLEGSNKRNNLPYTICPSVTDIVISDSISPLDMTATSFLIGFVGPHNNKIIMANNRKRGLEIPGGHIEPNENIIEAACREEKEETGAEVLIQTIVPIGFERIISSGLKPEKYRYSFPVGFQQFFAAKVILHDFVETEECRMPQLLSYQDIVNKNSPFDMSRKHILKTAWDIFGRS